MKTDNGEDAGRPGTIGPVKSDDRYEGRTPFIQPVSTT